MYERKYGSKYDKNLGTKEIAAKFRADVKAAQKAGELPASLTLSVRIKRFSGGSSIDVDVKDIGLLMFSKQWLERDPNVFTPCGERYTPEFDAVVKKLEAMLQAYNHDGSDAMTDYFDVKFYGHVSVWWEFERAREAEEKAAIAVTVVKPAAPVEAGEPLPAAKLLRFPAKAVDPMASDEDPMRRAF